MFRPFPIKNYIKLLFLSFILSAGFGFKCSAVDFSYIDLNHVIRTKTAFSKFDREVFSFKDTKFERLDIHEIEKQIEIIQNNLTSLRKEKADLLNKDMVLDIIGDSNESNWNKIESLDKNEKSMLDRLDYLFSLKKSHGNPQTNELFVLIHQIGNDLKKEVQSKKISSDTIVLNTLPYSTEDLLNSDVSQFYFYGDIVKTIEEEKEQEFLNYINQAPLLGCLIKSIKIPVLYKKGE